MGAVRLIAAMPAHLHTCRVGSSYLGILYSYTVAITPQRGHGSGIIASSAGPSRAQIQVASCNPSPPFAATSAPWSRPATTPRSTPITTRWNSGTGPIPKIRARRISRRPTRARCSTIPWSRSGRRRLSARLDRGQPGLVPRPSGAGQFLFWPRRRIRGYGWADSVTQDRWLGAALACERAAAALVQAMALSPRPIAACVTMMQMCAHFQEPYWLRQLFLGNAPETITHEDIDEPGMMDAALAHLVELGVPRLTPEQTPDALPSGLAPRAEHEMDQAKDYWLLRALDLRPGHLGALMAYAQYLRPRWGGSYEDIDGMAGGPLCAALSEPQRNAIRWIGILDSMGRLSGAGRRRGGGGIPRDVRIVPAARAAAGKRGMALGFTRSSSAIRWRIRSRRARCTHRARRHFRRTAISATWTGRSAASRTSASSTACRTTTAPSRASWNACAIGIPWLRREAWRRWPITTAAGVSRRTRRARSSCWTAPRCWRRTRRTTISTSWRRPPCCGMAATMSKAIS